MTRSNHETSLYAKLSQQADGCGRALKTLHRFEIQDAGSVHCVRSAPAGRYLGFNKPGVLSANSAVEACKIPADDDRLKRKQKRVCTDGQRDHERTPSVSCWVA